MLKDLNLAMAAAEDSGSATAMGNLAATLYQAMSDAGHGGDDFSATIKRIEQS